MDSDDDDLPVDVPDPEENIPAIWRGYLRNKRIKFEHDCQENGRFLRQVRQLALDVQKQTGRQFRVDTPVNRYTETGEIDPVTQQVYRHLNRFYFEPEDRSLSRLFDGVCIYVNGYTKPTSAELHTLMAFTGGRFTAVHDTHRTTHVIANAMATATSERTKKTTVTPEWILDSLQAGRLLPLQDYLLVKPRNVIKEMFARIPMPPEPELVAIEPEPPIRINVPLPPSASSSSRPQKRKPKGKQATSAADPKQLRIDSMFQREQKRAADPRHQARDIYLGRRGFRRANICGQTRPDQVCRILDEWIGTCDKLTDMDLTYVIRYLMALVDERQWTTLRQVLEHMRKAIDRCPETGADGPQWRMMFGQTIYGLLQQETSLPAELLPDGLFDFNE